MFRTDYQLPATTLPETVYRGQPSINISVLPHTQPQVSRSGIRLPIQRLTKPSALQVVVKKPTKCLGLRGKLMSRRGTTSMRASSSSSSLKYSQMSNCATPVDTALYSLAQTEDLEKRLEGAFVPLLDNNRSLVAQVIKMLPDLQRRLVGIHHNHSLTIRAAARILLQDLRENPELRQRLLRGDITPQQLIVMDRAPSQLVEERQQNRAEWERSLVRKQPLSNDWSNPLLSPYH